MSAVLGAWHRLEAWAAHDRPCPPVVLGALLASVAVVVAVAAVLPDGAEVRVLMAVAATVALAAIAVRSFDQGVVAVVVWLLLLGLVRRLASTFQADPSSDPLLLVAPVVVGILTVVAVARGALRDRSVLAWLVLGTSGLAVVAVLNPDQALRDGFEGLLSWLVPLLWFWIGRVAGTRLTERVLLVVTVGSVVAATYGLVQALVDFPPWDRRWIDERGYLALQVSGPDTLRQFGFSASAGEYALLLTVGMLLCALYVGRAWRHREPWTAWVSPLAGLAVLTPALALASVRTAVVLVVLAFAVVFVAERQWGLLRATAVVAGVGGLGWLVLSRIDTDGMSDQGAVGMVRRTIRGLSDPFGRDSTLRTHLDFTVQGFEEAADRPLGRGTSYGTTGNPGLENDVGNAGLAFGVAGLIAIIGTMVAGFLTAARAVRRPGGLVALATLGVLVLSLRFWWNGGHYAPAPLLWLLLGWADAAVRRPAEPAADEAHGDGSARVGGGPDGAGPPTAPVPA